jgi:aryl-phospho-beta-D-glucosidase BglC (GH1 family)
MEALMLYNQTKVRIIHRGWMVTMALLIIVTILLSSIGAPVNLVSAQAPAPAVFRVDAQGNITKDGVIFPVRGGSWFGLQGRYEPASDPDNPRGAPMEQYIGNVFWAPSGRTIQQDLNEMKALGINVIRLPLSHQTLDPNDPQGTDFLKNDPSVQIANSRLALETIVKAADEVGIYILFDIHSCSNYVDWRKGRLDARPPYVDATRDNYDFKREDSSCAATNNPASVTRIQAYNETIWLQDLTTLASMGTELGVTNIIGIDIFNEPWDYTWQEWKTLSEHAYTAINAVNPNILIFVQGISASAGNQDGTPNTITQVPNGSSGIDPNWGENLFEAGANPPAIPKNRLVYSPHAYGPSVFVGRQFADPAQPECAALEGDDFGDAECNIVINPTLLRQGWEEHFGYLKDLGYAVVIGEFGGNMEWPHGTASLRDQNRFGYLPNDTTDEQWQNAFVDYLISKGITDTIYWSINPESGDTGGIYTTPYRAGTNESGWGTWGPLDTKKVALLQRLWNAVPPVPTFTPTSTPTACVSCPTNTFTFTPTKTNTPTITSTPSGNIKVQISAAGTDNSQQTAFRYRVQNIGTSAQSNLSVRLYFTTDGSNAASAYVLEKYYDQSGVSTLSGPTLASGNTYYFTVNYGTASLPAGGSWEYQTALHLSSWGSTYNGANDWWHTSAAIPASYTDWVNLPAYVSGARTWGSEPTTGPTNTPSITPTASRTNTPTATPSRTNTPTVTPTGVTNTPTRTPTPTSTPTAVTVTSTFTPTATFTLGPTTLRVQYRAADTNAGDNQIKPHFNIVNPGGSAVPLSELKIRYWYTREGTTGQNFFCDWSAISGGCSNLTSSFVPLSPARTGANFYLEIGFSSAAGSIAAGGQSGDIQARFAKTDWSNFTETGDYSFDPTKTSFTDWNRVTLYRNGVLVWGVEP